MHRNQWGIPFEKRGKAIVYMFLALKRAYGSLVRKKTETNNLVKVLS